MRGRAVSVGGAPNGRAGKTDPELRITLEAVQLCIANADRLLSDSKKVSEPTAFALAETALEEILKGWALFHRMDTRGDNISSRTRDPNLKAFMEAIGGIKLERLFDSHEEKLQVLEPALEWIEGRFDDLEVAREGSASPESGSTNEPPHYLFSTAELQREIQLHRSLFGVVKQSLKAGLRREATSGLYVDKTPDGRIIAPSSQGLLYAVPIQRIVSLLIGHLQVLTLYVAGVVGNSDTRVGN